MCGVEQCCFVYIADDGAQPRAHHRLGTGHKRHGGHNHLVAIIPAFHLAQGQENKRQSIQSVANAYAVRHAEIGCKLLLEGLQLVAVEIPTALHDTLDGIAEHWFVGGIEGLEGEVRNHLMCGIK